MEQKNQQQEQPEVIFANISGNDEPTIIESICVRCEKQGQTTIMLTSIPMFKELVVSSFYCSECGYKNNDVQFGGKIGDFATTISLKCSSLEDFKRDVVRSEFSTIKIPELDFEIPTNKKGQVNTIEGFLMNTIEDLESEQEQRQVLWPEIYKKIVGFIKTIQEIMDGKHFPIHFIIDDPSGNSFIKNIYFPKNDPNLIIKERIRTKQECEEMGFSIENEEFERELVKQQQLLKQKQEQMTEEELKHNEKTIHAHKIDICKPFDEGDAKNEALTFKITCHMCSRDGENKMCIITIPYFKEITLMSFNCEFCGAKNSDIKVGGEISKQGIKITLNVESVEDLKRDLFKSETCGVIIPELDIELVHGTLGGVYTTVEGLLEKISDNLGKNNPFTDSDAQFKSTVGNIVSKIEELRTGDQKFTLILEDMLENSFIQNPKFPDEDPNCIAVKFDRDEDMNEILGITDMKA